MRLEIFESKGLAHNSYYLSDEGEALVVDPHRDCEVYLRAAGKDVPKSSMFWRRIGTRIM